MMTGQFAVPLDGDDHIEATVKKPFPNLSSGMAEGQIGADVLAQVTDLQQHPQARGIGMLKPPKVNGTFFRAGGPDLAKYLGKGRAIGISHRSGHGNRQSTTIDRHLALHLSGPL